MTLLHRATLALALTIALASPAFAQRLAPQGVVVHSTSLAFAAPTTPQTRSTGESVARSIAGGLVGGAIGTAALGFTAGILNTNRDRCSDNPDACTGYLVDGLVVGGMAGHAIGIPAGAWLANGRRGNLTKSLLVSGGIFVAELIAVSALVDDNYLVRDRSTLLAVLAAAPAAQLVSSAVIEAR